MTSLPPAGWYDDPTDAAMQRWWDGDKWTEHRRAPAPIATGGPASGDMRAPGEMVGHAFSLVRDRAGGIIASGLFAALPIVALFALVFVAASSVSFEFNVGETPDVDAEGGIALFFIVLVVALVVLAAAFLAMVTLLWDAAVGRERSWSAAVANGFRRLFPYLGWMLLGVAVKRDATIGR